MTQENKQLLLKDLCARLLYGVIIEYINDDYIITRTLDNHHFSMFDDYDIKPYLRPMSDMTKEETRIYNELYAERTNNNELDDLLQYSQILDYLNSIHVDYRGLIEKSLAIKVTKENNPYD